MEKHAYYAQKHQRGKEDGLYFFDSYKSHSKTTPNGNK